MIIIAGIQNLTIREATGRGIQISDCIYVTNDCSSQLGRILSQPFRLAIGGMESHSLITGQAAAYWKDLPNEEDPAKALHFLNAWLQALRAFFMALWVVRDNAVNCELGFLEHHVPGKGMTRTSNFIAALFSTARGSSDRIAFSAVEVRCAREYFLCFFLPLMFGLDLNDGRVPKLLINNSPPIISAKGLHRLTRFVYFLSAARCANDLGVKVSLYMTCLEIMFATEAAELTHRLSERVAFFLRNDSGERLELYKRLKEAYNIRSKVIHGSVMSEKTQMQLPEVATDIDELLRQLILKILADEADRRIFDMDNSKLDDYFARLTMGCV